MALLKLVGILTVVTAFFFIMFCGALIGQAVLL
jgi:hypothetical protein